MNKCALAFVSAAAILSLFAEDPVLDEDLRTGLVLWMDANTNVTLNAEGGVSEWRDVREAPGIAASSCQYVRAVHVKDYYSYFDSLAPTIRENVVGNEGRKFVDFGPFHSDKWLIWRNASDQDKVCPVRSYFAFIKLNSASASVPVGPMLAGTGSTVGYSYNGTQARWIYTKTFAEGFLTNGETRVNGRAVPSNYAWPATEDCYLISQIGPFYPDNHSYVQFNNFGNSLGMHEIVPGRTPTKPGEPTDPTNTKYVNGNRQGGAIIGEILCYNRCVTDEERRRIEAYLLAKWPKTERHVRDLAASDGDFEKTGDDTLVIERNSGAYENVIALKAGSVAAGQNQTLPKLELQAGLTATVATGSVSVTSGRAGVFSASGTGLLTIGGLGEGVAKIESDGVDLRLPETGMWLSPLEDPASTFKPTSLLENGGFELPALASTSYKTNPNLPGWSYVGDNNIVVLLGSDEPTYHNKDVSGEAPEGQHVLCLHAKYSYAQNPVLTQAFSVSETGIYAVRLWHANRSGGYPSRFFVEVDGTNLVDFTSGHDSRGLGTNSSWDAVKSKYIHFYEYEFPTPTLGPGTHVLTIKEVVTRTADTATCGGLFDDVRVVPLRRGSYVWVPDSSFDSHEGFVDKPLWNQSHWQLFSDLAAKGDAASSWRFGADASPASSFAGITQDSQIWYWEGRTNELTRLADFRKGFLTNRAQMSNTVSFAAAGDYTLSLRYSKASYGVAVGDHSCTVTLTDGDGVEFEIGKFWPKTASTVVYENGFVVPRAGTYTLTFKNTDLPAATGSGENVRGTILDDIAIRVGVAEPPTPIDYENSPYAQCFNNGGVIPADGTIVCPVTFETTGVYRASLTLKGQDLALTSSLGPFHGVNFYPHVLNVLFDGEPVGRLAVDEPLDVVFRLTLPHAPAGAHALALASDASASAPCACSILKAIGFDRLTEATPPAVDLTDVRLALSGGAKLALDFEGVKTVRGLRVDGRPLFGTVGAGTCPSITGRGSLTVCPVGMTIIFR